MSRYPFLERVNDYMPSLYGHLEEITYKTRYRRYKQLSRIFEDMKVDPDYTLTTTNPRDMVPEDIKEFVKYRRLHDVAAVTILDDLSHLKDLLEAYDNFSVTRFKSKYRKFWPKKYRKKPKQLSPVQYNKIVNRAQELVKSDCSDWSLFRAYGVVMWSLMAGMRPQEVQWAEAFNVEVVDPENKLMRIWIEHVKGAKSYGEPRWAPVLPDGFDFCNFYLKRRAEAMAIPTDALIPKMQGSGGYLSYNKLNVCKVQVEKDLGISFPLRICRATWIMKLKKMGVRGEDASLAAGHGTTVTTEEDYYRKGNDDAVEDIFNIFKKDGKTNNLNAKTSISAISGKLKSENATAGYSSERTGGDSNPRPAA